jgi:hypothetical protein
MNGYRYLSLTIMDIRVRIEVYYRSPVNICGRTNITNLSTPECAVVLFSSPIGINVYLRVKVKKVQIFLCLIKHNAIKTYGEWRYSSIIFYLSARSR